MLVHQEWVAHMATWTLELSAHRNQTSPPGAKLTALHQQGKNVEAWWYTCSNVIWRLFFFSTMIAVSVNSYTCSRAVCGHCKSCCPQRPASQPLI